MNDKNIKLVWDVYGLLNESSIEDIEEIFCKVRDVKLFWLNMAGD